MDNFFWELQLLIAALREGIIAKGKSLWKLVTSASFLGVLTLLATVLSAGSALFTWRAAESANQVAKDSQAFAQKIYNDQIALGRPSISVLSGMTFTYEGEAGSNFSEQVTNKYAATLVLRNSGQRDSARVWVALSTDRGLGSADSIEVKLLKLPKDVDIPVQFDLYYPASVGSTWYVGLVYEDEVPAESFDPVNAPSKKPLPLRVICSSAIVVKMSSWPKDLAQDTSASTLSSGTPVPVSRRAFDQYGRAMASTTAEAIRNNVVDAARQEGACLDVEY